jgi:hypothetical protein
MNASLEAALAYIAKGWPVCLFRQRGNKKFPLTEHGHLDATLDPAQAEAWLRQYPNALIAIATGERSGVVSLDIDIRSDESGFETLESQCRIVPTSPTAHSPQGGCAVLLAWPGHRVKSCNRGEIGAHLDVRGDGACQILPPGPGRWWDPHLGLETPLASMPAWMIAPAPVPVRPAKPVRPCVGLSPYADAAIEYACRAIRGAANGHQYATLYKESFSIGTLAGAGGIPADFARAALIDAGCGMTNFRLDLWTLKDVTRTVDDGFRAGLARPRPTIGNGRARR